MRELLTRREWQAARFVTFGLTHKETALEMGIAVQTVDAHIHSCFDKLGCDNVVMLATKVWEELHGKIHSDHH